MLSGCLRQSAKAAAVQLRHSAVSVRPLLGFGTTMVVGLGSCTHTPTGYKWNKEGRGRRISACARGRADRPNGHVSASEIPFRNDWQILCVGRIAAGAGSKDLRVLRKLGFGLCRQTRLSRRGCSKASSHWSEDGACCLGKGSAICSLVYVSQMVVFGLA